MLKSSIDRKKLTLRLQPDGRLKASDFEKLRKQTDPVIKKYGSLNGVMVVAESFPGWEDFDSALAHLQFVRSHQKHVKKIALVTKDKLLKQAATRASSYHFIHPEVRTFDAEKKALAWLHL